MVTGVKQLGGRQGGGTEGALLGKVSGARRAGGRPCQLSLCCSGGGRGEGRGDSKRANSKGSG